MNESRRWYPFMVYGRLCRASESPSVLRCTNRIRCFCYDKSILPILSEICIICDLRYTIINIILICINSLKYLYLKLIFTNNKLEPLRLTAATVVNLSNYPLNNVHHCLFRISSVGLTCF